MGRISGARRVFSAVLSALLFVQLTGCYKVLETAPQDRSLNGLIRSLTAEVDRNANHTNIRRLTWARHLEDIVEKTKQIAEAIPRLDGELRGDLPTAETFVQTNRARIEDWIDRMIERSKPLRAMIYDLSQEAFESTDEAVITWNHLLILSALHYHRGLTQTLLRTASPLVLGVASKDFNDSKSIKTFRKWILDRFFSFMGAGIVAGQDIAEVLSTLKGMSGLAALRANVTQLQSDLASLSLPDQQMYSNLLSQLPQADRDQVQQSLGKFKRGFKAQSFLYTPFSDRSLVVSIFTWIGNLTWGLVNSLIGVGIILATMMVSPFFESVNFPTFKLARNGLQIYVDVSGISPISGKMSMGIFEFDNYSSWEFASGHEGGHSIQSAILGPFYLPAVMMSYLISGFDQGFIEEWADAWSDGEPHRHHDELKSPLEMGQVGGSIQ